MTGNLESVGAQQVELAHRVAVVGAGPAGMFAAQALLSATDVGAVDVIERLPVPHGLVRFGVAPDHPKTKAVSRIFDRTLADPRIRFFGNVDIGTDIDVSWLRSHYDAVVFATGAGVDRPLGVPGEDLLGSVGAAEFVPWYSGHPDAAHCRFDLNSPRAVVVGGGNVALDLIRILAKDPSALRETDLPSSVLAALETSRIEHIHVLVRRGPADVKYSPAQLREIGELDGVDVAVTSAGSFRSPEAGEGGRQTGDEALQILREFRDRPRGTASRSITFHFHSRIVGLDGDGAGRLSTARVRTADPDGVVGAHDWDIPTGLVLRAVGYRALPLPGLPFDGEKGIVPNTLGSVTGDEYGSTEGLYVAGWLKRGATGVIGTNRADAVETVNTLLADVRRRQTGRGTDPDALERRLLEQGTRFLDFTGWQRIAQEETRLGAKRGAATVKLSTRADMLVAALGPEPVPS